MLNKIFKLIFPRFCSYIIVEIDYNVIAYGQFLSATGKPINFEVGNKPLILPAVPIKAIQQPVRIMTHKEYYDRFGAVGYYSTFKVRYLFWNSDKPITFFPKGASGPRGPYLNR